MGFSEQIPHVAAGDCPIMSMVQLRLQNPAPNLASFLRLALLSLVCFSRFLSNQCHPLLVIIWPLSMIGSYIPRVSPTNLSPLIVHHQTAFKSKSRCFCLLPAGVHNRDRQIGPQVRLPQLHWREAGHSLLRPGRLFPSFPSFE